LIHVSYDIVFEPIEDELNGDMDPELKKEREEIYYDMHKNPKKQTPRVEAMIEKYPDDPVLYNWLSVAYRLTDKHEKAKDLIHEMYRKFPDYLFAKMAYIELCLEEDNLVEIPRILENKYELKFHYPERTKFHVSEFTAFAGTVGLYFCRIGKPEIGQGYYEMLKAAAPDDPQTMRLKSALKVRVSLIEAMKKFLRFQDR
jgi:hypothetical protein